MAKKYIDSELSLNFKNSMGLKVITPTSVMYPNEIALRRLTWNINQVVNVENRLCL